ncbi:ESX secretion-associated protein EspG [Nocardia nova]|uniref:ESX secretion-associated protein EspG n=1 Tax=Nocardia nova TaxID=37330 RepID=A0A2S6AY88_9NOCA|nr:ESX secretion-associated protein EspG [Nocardia nova]PPJ28465.1 ESX secretion-associated protein EspG [Nocardia nova]PPJ40163.1 ESX secretion-associated protein EspG [Nocardia nova]
MSERRWRFDAAEFRVLWEVTGRDVLPYPLAHRFTAEHTVAEVDRTRRRIAERLLPQVDDDLERAIALLLDPEVRVEVTGFRGRNREHRIRIHAAAHDRHGAVVVQEPGPEATVGGTVRLSLLGVERVPAAVVAELPECSQGQGKPLNIPVDDLEAPAAHVRDPWVVGPKEQLARFLKRPASATFHIAAYPWGSPDNRHTNGRKDFQIMDFLDDGRYAIFGDRILRIKPTDSTRMTAQVRDMIIRTTAEIRDGVHPRP